MSSATKSFNSDAISMSVEKFLNEATKGMASELLEWMKNKFEANMHHMVGENLGSITMNIVVDSSCVISELNRYAKGKSSLLFHLTKNPIFPLCAPPLLENEVTDYIENKTKKKYNKNKLLEGWKKLRSVITIKEIHNEEAIKKGKEVMKRDPNDSPFLSLVIDTGASAILAHDNDFEDTVRRFSVNTLGDMVGIYHRGLFSFFIMSDFVPTVLELAGRLIAIIVKILFDILGFIATITKTIINEAINGLTKIVSRIPDWAIGIVIAVTLVSMFIVTIHDDTRKKVILTLKSLWRKTKPTIDKIVSWLVHCIENLLSYLQKSSPYIGMSAIVLNDLHKQVIKFHKEVKAIKLEDTVYYS